MFGKNKSLASLDGFGVRADKQWAIILSVLLHGVVLFAIFGDFNFFKPPDRAEEIILQAVLLPDAKPVADGEQEKTEKRPPIPPPPPPPPPPPTPPPAPQAAAQPLPAPEVAPPPPPEPPQEEEVDDVPQPLVEVPEETPNSEELSRSILKSLEELEEQVPEGEDDETTRKPLSGVAEKLPSAAAADKVVSSPLSADEIRILRQAIAQCWSVSAGARNAQDLVIEVRIEFLSDGSVAQAEVIDSARMRSDSFFRVAAEDALRALYHPQCERLPLPLEKYESWKILIFEFDTREMLG